MSFKESFKKTAQWVLIRPKTTGVIVFLIMLVLLSFLVKLRYEVIKENERREMSNILQVARQNFEQVLKNSYTSALSLAMTINDKGEPEYFDKIAPQLVDKNKSIDAVQLVPNGVIKYVYPYEENKEAIDYDILNSPYVKYEARKSIQSKLMYFAGPLKLKQGGIGVVGRLPIYKNNKFWGFSAVVIRLETLIKQSGINAIDDTKYYFQFSKVNPSTLQEEFFLPQDKALKDKSYLMVDIPDGDWKLYLISRNQNGIINQLYTSISLSLLLAIMVSLWVTSILKKPAELQKLIEIQTQKIIKREAEFGAIFNQAPVGIAKIDTTTGNFITINKEYGRIVGYSTEELLATNFQSITYPDDLQIDLDHMDKIKKGIIDDFCIEKRYIHKTGKIVWVNLVVAVLWKEGNRVLNHIAIVEDITDKKRAVEELNLSFKLVSEQNKRLLNFSYIVSHNLRSHTSNIELISSLLDGVKTKEEQDEMVDLLKQVSKSLDETMRNLNEVVNIRTNINLTIESLNLHQFIENSLNILQRQIQDKQVVIENRVPLHIQINYNAAYLESILYNFISNAIRYSHPERKPLIILTFDEAKKALSISDNGIGINLKRNREDLFGMYKTFNSNPDAKGIGLFISKNQIDTMGGKIETESEVNVGTTFTIYFK
ncbi:PAS domain S-box protein [Flavobacterium sp. J49]|uniref:sensor histidine kinase n=1 Tax=Flavobacterium sp. J49 TaxID=2718534 RepID=UPI001593BD65|nr:PAS domain S-box protein [Flavobacterium sp. J49]MBF6640038.1 PAS domain S-box protein [Flavobacterium sp. J49]NIC01283.1 PAS domain S-box protein [Flavobacterium sp. J49]